MNKRISFSLLAALVVAVMIGGSVFYSRDKFFVDNDKSSVMKKMIGEVKFSLSDRVFLVPKRYVKSYSVKKTDGALSGFTIRLPVLNGTGEAEVIISLDGRSKGEMERYWYSNVYQFHRGRLSGWKESTNQKGEKLEEAGERAFLIKKDRVLRMLRCGARICQATLSYSNNVQLYVVFDEKLRRNWLDLTEQLILDFAHFEKSGSALGR